MVPPNETNKDKTIKLLKLLLTLGNNNLKYIPTWALI